MRSTKLGVVLGKSIITLAELPRGELRDSIP